MKKNHLFLVSLFLSFVVTSGFSQNLDKLNLSGTVKNVSSGKIYLQRYENKSFFTIDSAKIKDGNFKFASQIKLPEIYGLSLYGSGENPFESFIIFLDNKPITVELDTINEFEKTVVKGSKEHDLFLELSKLRRVPISKIIGEHPSSLAALYLFYRNFSYRLSPKEINEAIALLDPSFQNTEYVKVLTSLAETLDKTAVGQKAPDFTAYDVDGKSVKLSDYLGKGLVLIDFWASWCPPCRKEIPHLQELYKQYHAKGFEIVGVSLDNKIAPWKKALEKDGSPWIQLVDQKAWAGEGVTAYGVRLIPANNFLINKEGIIIAKGVHNDALDKTLDNLLSGE
jgi:peroxiredoxin